MNIRPITPADTENCGRIMYEAFCSIDDLRRLPRDVPSEETGIHLAQVCINTPEICGFVAEDENGNFLGSNFLWEHDAIRGVGPITIDPNMQSKGVGRSLMQAVVERGKDAPGIRLVQGAYNLVSMSLYTDLGFETVEPLVIMEGVPTGEPSSNETNVRPLEERDLAECADLCRKIHGFDRANELKQISQMFPSFVAERDGRIAAYTSAPISWQINHAVAETTEDLQYLLLGAAKQIAQPLSFLLPMRQSELFRWCLKNGLRATKPLTLMKIGAYQEPTGAFLPSVLY